MVCNFEEITIYNNVPNEATNEYKWIRMVLWKLRWVDIDPYASFFYRLDRSCSLLVKLNTRSSNVCFAHTSCRHPSISDTSSLGQSENTDRDRPSAWCVDSIIRSMLTQYGATMHFSFHAFGRHIERTGESGDR